MSKSWLGWKATLLALILAPAIAQAQASPPPACDPAALGELLLDLFPPAPVQRRVESARRLGGCRAKRAVGALSRVLEFDGELQVKVEAAHALERLGTDEAKRVLDAALRSDAALAEQLNRRPAQVPETQPTGQPTVQPADAPLRVPEKITVAEVVHPPIVASPTPAQAPAIAPSPTQIGSAQPTEPTEPSGPENGTVLSITTSALAGASLATFLSFLGEQDQLGMLLLMGISGTTIGGGTALGLSRFGLRPTLAQAAWYTNATAWGTLAGLAIHAGSGSTSDKLRWGLLVSGETLGIGAGIWGSRWEWRPGQIALADSLVLGLGLGAGGIRGLRNLPLDVTPVTAIGVVPAMVASALASRYVDLSREDLQLVGVTALSASWSGALLASGASGEKLLQGRRSQGGLLAGLGLGYLGATTAAAFTEAPPSRVYGSGAGLLLGNALGLGLGMVLDPEQRRPWSLASGLGGLGLGIAAYAYDPLQKLGPQAPSMAAAGALYGAGTWWLASYAGYRGERITEADQARLRGGLLAGGAVVGLAGLLTSRAFDPTGDDFVTAGLGTGLGISAGLGVAKLGWPSKGAPESWGVLLGSAAGLAAGAATAHATRLRPADLGASFAGAGYGALFGTLAPTLGKPEWDGARKAEGGALLGLSLGALGATAARHFSEASGAQVAIPALAGLFGMGMGMGVGAGLMWPGSSLQPARAGTVAGGSALIVSSLLAERHLKLSEGLGPSAPGLGLLGGLLGSGYGLLLAATADPSGLLAATPGRQLAGGWVFGLSSGMATGLVLSKIYEPTAEDLALALSGATLGGAFGLGLSNLAFETRGRHDTTGLLLGSASGLLGGAVAARTLRLRQPDVGAGFAGLAYGALLGTLAPSLGQPEWDGARRGSGGALLGLSLGAVGAAMAAHLCDATGAQVLVPSVAGLFGLGMGAGAGMLWPGGSSRSVRIGTVAGGATLIASSLLAEPRLKLADGLGSSATGFGGMGAVWGWGFGTLLAGAVDASGQVYTTPDRQLAGGRLLGASAGLAAGLTLSKYYTLDLADAAVGTGSTLLGGLAGLGIANLAYAQEGRPDTVLSLAGAAAGLGAAGWIQHRAPMDQADELAALAGIGYGAFLGAEAPALGKKEWPGFDRPTSGWTLLGASAGGFGALALRRASSASESSVILSALGGLDGLTTGLGLAGLLNAQNSQPGRIAATAGTLAGLGIGMGAWPRLSYQPSDIEFIAAGSAVGAWTAMWVPALGHASWEDVDGLKMASGFVFGGGLGSFAASLLAPALQVDEDLTLNAMAMDALLSGAGLGAGMLASERYDAGVGAMLGAGGAGLLLGAALHRSIELRAQDPLLLLAALEGLWLGAWLPAVLYEPGRITQRQEKGGMLAGELGGRRKAACSRESWAA